MAEDGAIARLSHVTLEYGAARALDDLTLSIAPGEWLCVLGSNGSGKSTLANVLAGLLAPDAGSVELAGEAVLRDGEMDAQAYARARKSLGLVFQNPDDQLVTTVVEDDVAFGPENLGLTPSEITERVERELARVALTPLAKADPTRLSGGQKQRVAIAGALAMEPKLLVLDEPGASLDVRGRTAILRVMRRLHEAGHTIVHITHFMDEALAADRVVALEHGRIALSGTPAEVFAHAERVFDLGLEEPYVAQLASALRERGVNVPWTCSEGELAEALSALSRSRGSFDSARPACPAQDDMRSEVIRASHLSYAYERGATPALGDVSFAIPRGAHVAIVGQTGSGKSTLLRLLAALEVPTSGSLEIDGVSTATRAGRRSLHGRVGYVMQHPERQLFAETVADDVAFGPRNLGLAEDEVQLRVASALHTVGLTAKAEASPFELSGGQKRLAAIAGILAMNPEILVLDEPTAGLDPRGRAQLRSILDNVAAQGTTTIEVTHSMENAAQAEYLYVLDGGRIILEGAPEAVFAEANEAQLRADGLGLPWALGFARRLGLQLAAPYGIEQLAEEVARHA